jgi:ribosome-binding protein aMBF1 (putative translation factor)
MNAIRPIAETKETVTLSRADYEAILEALEDAEDIAAARGAEAAVKAGESEYLPIEMIERLANEPTVKVWREHRGLSQRELAEKAGVSVSYLNEIEGGKKPGSVKTLKALAEAMGLALDDLA